MPRKRFTSTLQTVTEINITPLMDLTFLLLIVFMITAPILEFETDVSPPQMATDKHVSEEDEPLLINLNRAGKILFEKQELSQEELTRILTSRHQRKPDVSAFIRADEKRPYGEVIGIMRAVREANISNVSLVTQPET